MKHEPSIKDLILLKKIDIINTREQIQNLLSNHSNWLRYWRGGSIKKGIFSPYEKQNLFKGLNFLL